MRSLAFLFYLLASTATAAELSPIQEQGLERLVLQDCGSCHGMTLKGGLGPDIRAQTLTDWEPDALRMVILDGVEGTPMPPWRPLLSDDEVDWIVNYLKKGGTQ